MLLKRPWQAKLFGLPKKSLILFNKWIEVIYQIKFQEYDMIYDTNLVSTNFAMCDDKNLKKKASNKSSEEFILCPLSSEIRENNINISHKDIRKKKIVESMSLNTKSTCQSNLDSINVIHDDNVTCKEASPDGIDITNNMSSRETNILPNSKCNARLTCVNDKSSLVVENNSTSKETVYEDVTFRRIPMRTYGRSKKCIKRKSSFDNTDNLEKNLPYKKKKKNRDSCAKEHEQSSHSIRRSTRITKGKWSSSNENLNPYNKNFVHRITIPKKSTKINNEQTKNNLNSKITTPIITENKNVKYNINQMCVPGLQTKNILPQPKKVIEKYFLHGLTQKQINMRQFDISDKIPYIFLRPVSPETISHYTKKPHSIENNCNPENHLDSKKNKSHGIGLSVSTASKSNSTTIINHVPNSAINSSFHVQSTSNTNKKMIDKSKDVVHRSVLYESTASEKIIAQKRKFHQMTTDNLQKSTNSKKLKFSNIHENCKSINVKNQLKSKILEKKLNLKKALMQNFRGIKTLPYEIPKVSKLKQSKHEEQNMLFTNKKKELRRRITRSSTLVCPTVFKRSKRIQCFNDKNDEKINEINTEPTNTYKWFTNINRSHLWDTDLILENKMLTDFEAFDYLMKIVSSLQKSTCSDKIYFYKMCYAEVAMLRLGVNTSKMTLFNESKRVPIYKRKIVTRESLDDLMKLSGRKCQKRGKYLKNVFKEGYKDYIGSTDITNVTSDNILFEVPCTSQTKFKSNEIIRKKDDFAVDDNSKEYKKTVAISNQPAEFINSIDYIRIVNSESNCSDSDSEVDLNIIGWDFNRPIPSTSKGITKWRYIKENRRQNLLKNASTTDSAVAVALSEIHYEQNINDSPIRDIISINSYNICNNIVNLFDKKTQWTSKTVSYLKSVISWSKKLPIKVNTLKLNLITEICNNLFSIKSPILNCSIENSRDENSQDILYLENDQLKNINLSISATRNASDTHVFYNHRDNNILINCSLSSSEIFDQSCLLSLIQTNKNSRNTQNSLSKTETSATVILSDFNDINYQSYDSIVNNNDKHIENIQNKTLSSMSDNYNSSAVTCRNILSDVNTFLENLSNNSFVESRDNIIFITSNTAGKKGEGSLDFEQTNLPSIQYRLKGVCNHNKFNFGYDLDESEINLSRNSKNFIQTNIIKNNIRESKSNSSQTRHSIQNDIQYSNIVLNNQELKYDFSKSKNSISIHEISDTDLFDKCLFNSTNNPNFIDIDAFRDINNIQTKIKTPQKLTFQCELVENKSQKFSIIEESMSKTNLCKNADNILNVSFPEVCNVIFHENMCSTTNEILNKSFLEIPDAKRCEERIIIETPLNKTLNEKKLFMYNDDNYSNTCWIENKCNDSFKKTNYKYSSKNYEYCVNKRVNYLDDSSYNFRDKSHNFLKFLNFKKNKVTCFDYYKENAIYNDGLKLNTKTLKISVDINCIHNFTINNVEFAEKMIMNMLNIYSYKLSKYDYIHIIKKLSNSIVSEYLNSPTVKFLQRPASDYTLVSYSKKNKTINTNNFDTNFNNNSHVKSQGQSNIEYIDGCVNSNSYNSIFTNLPHVFNHSYVNHVYGNKLFNSNHYIKRKLNAQCSTNIKKFKRSIINNENSTSLPLTIQNLAQHSSKIVHKLNLCVSHVLSFYTENSNTNHFNNIATLNNFSDRNASNTNSVADKIQSIALNKNTIATSSNKLLFNSCLLKNSETVLQENTFVNFLKYSNSVDNFFNKSLISSCLLNSHNLVSNNDLKDKLRISIYENSIAQINKSNRNLYNISKMKNRFNQDISTTSNFKMFSITSDEDSQNATDGVSGITETKLPNHDEVFISDVIWNKCNFSGAFNDSMSTFNSSNICNISVNDQNIVQNSKTLLTNRPMYELLLNKNKTYQIVENDGLTEKNNSIWSISDDSTNSNSTNNTKNIIFNEHNIFSINIDNSVDSDNDKVILISESSENSFNNSTTLSDSENTNSVKSSYDEESIIRNINILEIDEADSNFSIVRGFKSPSPGENESYLVDNSIDNTSIDCSSTDSIYMNHNDGRNSDLSIISSTTSSLNTWSNIDTSSSSIVSTSFSSCSSTKSMIKELTKNVTNKCSNSKIVDVIGDMNDSSENSLIIQNDNSIISTSNSGSYIYIASDFTLTGKDYSGSENSDYIENNISKTKRYILNDETVKNSSIVKWIENTKPITIKKSKANLNKCTNLGQTFDEVIVISDAENDKSMYETKIKNHNNILLDDTLKNTQTPELLNAFNNINKNFVGIRSPKKFSNDTTCENKLEENVSIIKTINITGSMCNNYKNKGSADNINYSDNDNSCDSNTSKSNYHDINIEDISNDKNKMLHTYDYCKNKLEKKNHIESEINNVDNLFPISQLVVSHNSFADDLNLGIYKDDLAVFKSPVRYNTEVNENDFDINRLSGEFNDLLGVESNFACNFSDFENENNELAFQENFFNNNVSESSINEISFLRCLEKNSIPVELQDNISKDCSIIEESNKNSPNENTEEIIIKKNDKFIINSLDNFNVKSDINLNQRTIFSLIKSDSQIKTSLKSSSNILNKNRQILESTTSKKQSQMYLENNMNLNDQIYSSLQTISPNYSILPDPVSTTNFPLNLNDIDFELAVSSALADANKHESYHETVNSFDAATHNFPNAIINVASQIPTYDDAITRSYFNSIKAFEMLSIKSQNPNYSPTNINNISEIGKKFNEIRVCNSYTKKLNDFNDDRGSPAVKLSTSNLLTKSLDNNNVSIVGNMIYEDISDPEDETVSSTLMTPSIKPMTLPKLCYYKIDDAVESVSLQNSISDDSSVNPITNHSPRDVDQIENPVIDPHDKTLNKCDINKEVINESITYGKMCESTISYPETYQTITNENTTISPFISFEKEFEGESMNLACTDDISSNGNFQDIISDIIVQPAASNETVSQSLNTSNIYEDISSPEQNTTNKFDPMDTLKELETSTFSMFNKGHKLLSLEGRVINTSDIVSLSMENGFDFVNSIIDFDNSGALDDYDCIRAIHDFDINQFQQDDEICDPIEHLFDDNTQLTDTDQFDIDEWKL
ncbi:protein PF3D7_1417600-like [Daktulosphaira vitifoliae]|uniref:protein PF3D7_1417600-like n=1 Tax=Daktulosphaira vitifoliae TaxID=58002 RepID=UPI0021AAEC74|nr:protein PF3D7_1417600-like [Daktulosphaira vitifoliae]XP_050531216.1 protein PF3D7_1417600-like [Daktulosphaira vitifoliae]